MLSDNEYFLNSSGCWCANETQLDDLYNTNLNIIVTKTCTLYAKTGNKEPTFFKESGMCINSKGLPNPGYNYYKNLYNKYSSLFSREKRFILSVAWEHHEENTIELLNDYNSFIGSKNPSPEKELVELNLSCPNLNHEIPAYNPILFEKILKKINSLNLNNVYFSLKLSPYLDHSICNKIIDIINENNDNEIFKYVVLSNSIPNCLILKNNIPVLSNTYGGLSGGKFNKSISLSNVYYFKDKLNANIKIIGCGGIETIDDVYDYLNNGASHVQLGSCFYNEKTNNLDYDKINSLILSYKGSQKI